MRIRDVLAAALAATAVQTGTEILTVVFLGKIFEEFTILAAGHQRPTKAFDNVIFWVNIMAAVAAVHVLASSIFLRSWIKFGEQQAMGARLRLFKCMILKEMAWFDSHKDGLPSMMTANQRYKPPSLPLSLR
jgi:ATP-binding cassette subfamily B (MDR/TAP) protein 1